MIKVAPSILSADFCKMAEAVNNLKQWNADIVHCDVMDGELAYDNTTHHAHFHHIAFSSLCTCLVFFLNFDYFKDFFGVEDFLG